MCSLNDDWWLNILSQSHENLTEVIRCSSQEQLASEIKLSGSYMLMVARWRHFQYLYLILHTTMHILVIA